MSIKERLIKFFSGQTREEREATHRIVERLEKQLAHDELTLEAIIKGDIKEAERLRKCRP